MIDIYSLLPLYFNNKCSNNQIAFVEEWIYDNREEFESLKEAWFFVDENIFHDYDSKTSWNQFEQKFINTSKVPIFKIGLFKYFVAASILFIISIFVVLMFSDNQSQQISEIENTELNKLRKSDHASRIRYADVTMIDLERSGTLIVNKNSEMTKLQGMEDKNIIELVNGDFIIDAEKIPGGINLPVIVKFKSFELKIKNAVVNLILNDDKISVSVLKGNVELIDSSLNQIEIVKDYQMVIESDSIQIPHMYKDIDINWSKDYFSF